ncbi:MAG: Tannase and feruloyl esterase [Rhodospirillales bacterium]|nr:Tannase and feruloyl esterase [Rhodospirillales bacterium]
MRYSLTLALLLAATGSAHAADAPRRTEAECTALANRVLGYGVAQVASAKLTAEDGPSPAACTVQVHFTESELKFEARLPMTGWNGKLAFLGGGGFDGVISPPTMPYVSPSVLADRYATMTTNGGHDASRNPLTYFNADFAYDAAKLVDFTYQSEHRALPAGKELIQAFYGSVPTRSYFEGCSMGGHDALIEAQRYPGDFDGIVARAPAGNVLGLFERFHRTAMAVDAKGGSLNDAKQTLLAKAVLAQCDKLDGIEDGILAKPSACNFDARKLRCPDGKDTGDTCLSDAQLATIEAVTAKLSLLDGLVTHEGFFFGGENSEKGWGEYIWPQLALLNNSMHGLFSQGFLRAFVMRDADFDVKKWKAESAVPQLKTIKALFQADDPDLSKFAARGGKLILWNGMTDVSVSPKETALYYDRVVKTMGQADADKTVELFFAPGVGHCFGGPGADQVDLLRAMAQWVEQGTRPSQQSLIAKHVPTPAATRPLCKYPSYARYGGSGDVNDAASFRCSTD